MQVVHVILDVCFFTSFVSGVVYAVACLGSFVLLLMLENDCLGFTAFLCSFDHQEVYRLSSSLVLLLVRADDRKHTLVVSRALVSVVYRASRF